MDQEVAEARARLKAKFGDGAQIGGKGTQRRTKKKTHTQTQVTEDKKLKSAIKKFGVQTLPEIDEVNMFKDDNTVLHIKRPQVQFSMREHLLVVTGVSESRQLQDMIPDILKQVGPQQYEAIQKLVAGAGGDAKG